jgi:hypothetical protein
LRKADTRGGALFPRSTLDVGNDIWKSVPLAGMILAGRQDEQHRDTEIDEDEEKKRESDP